MSAPDVSPENSPDAWRGLWVVAEQRQGQLLEVGLEILGEARRLAGQLNAAVSALVLGDGVAGHAGELIGRGADRVYVADDPVLAHYNPDAYSAVIVDLVLAQRPQILLLGATNVGRDLAPTVAARLRTGLCADCTALDLDAQHRLLQIAPVLGGKELATMLCPLRRPQMATVRPGVFAKRPREERPGEVVPVAVGLAARQTRTAVRGVFTEELPGRPLEQVEIVVAGGAGIDGAEGWQLIHQLAGVLDAGVGGTRPPMDEGHLREDQMIGQSGVTIRPKLYICIGISGDIQHTVGFQDAGIVVAINKDPKAPIFKVADYGIVGDYREVVPLLIEELQRA